MGQKVLKNAKKNCFASKCVGRSVICGVLDETDCNDCRFYMTKAEYEAKCSHLKYKKIKKED